MRPLRRLMAFWRQQGVLLPSDLIAWLHARTDLGLPREAPALGYFPARVQDQILALAQVDEQLHVALCGAVGRYSPSQQGTGLRPLRRLLGGSPWARRRSGMAWWARTPPPSALHAAIDWRRPRSRVLSLLRHGPGWQRPTLCLRTRTLGSLRRVRSALPSRLLGYCFGLPPLRDHAPWRGRLCSRTSQSNAPSARSSLPRPP